MKITEKNINRIKFEYNITQIFKSPAEPIFNDKNWQKSNRNQILNEYNNLKQNSDCYIAIKIRYDRKTYSIEQLRQPIFISH
jgi:hypothetical protein